MLLVFEFRANAGGNVSCEVVGETVGYGVEMSPNKPVVDFPVPADDLRAVFHRFEVEEPFVGSVGESQFPGVVGAGRNFGHASGDDIVGMEMQPRGKRGFLIRKKAFAFGCEDFCYKPLLDE